MSKTITFAVIPLLLFSLLFMSLGYAQLSDELAVSGTANIKVQTGVFIHSAEVSEADRDTLIINSKTSTLLNSTVTLGSEQGSRRSVTVSVVNNSDYGYVYDGTLIADTTDAYDNDSIAYFVTGISEGFELAPHAETRFTLTFSYAGSDTSAPTLNSLIKFNFVLASEYVPEFVANTATERFEQVLDNPTEFDSLITQMEESSNRADSSYIGNVFGATTEDSEFLEQLFVDENGNSLLRMNVDGVEAEATIMIKRENIDGNTSTGDSEGREMTIYMTADDISSIQSSFWSPGKARVFATVYTKDTGADNWYQLGSTYEGEASVNNYTSGAWGTDNSFDTDTWRSTVQYYTAASGSDISDIISAFKAL